MTSNRITQLTTGMVYFTFVYGIGATICNALLEWNIFPTYTVCLVEEVVEKELDNSVVLAFFVMPSLLMAYTTPIIDLVTFRLMKFWSNQSRQIPKGNLPNGTIWYHIAHWGPNHFFFVHKSLDFQFYFGHDVREFRTTGGSLVGKEATSTFNKIGISETKYPITFALK